MSSSGPVADARDVRCPTCGAPCPADDVDAVRCEHCGASVPVPEDVRVHVFAMRVLAASAQDAAGRAPIALPRVEASCARCGHALRFEGNETDRCPACHTVATANAGGAATVFLAGLKEVQERREALLAEATGTLRENERAKQEALAELRRRIAELDRREALVLASRPSTWSVVRPFLVAFALIALFCWVAYRIDLATSR